MSSKSPYRGKAAKLPPLSFGEGKLMSLNDMYDRLRKVSGDVERLEAPGNPSNFASRSAAIKIGDVEFTSMVHTPMLVARREQNIRTLVIPRVGEFSAKVGGSRLVGCAGQTGVLFSGAARVLQSGLLSTVAVRLDDQRFTDTLHAMQGLPAGGVDLQRDREIALQTGPASFGVTLRLLCEMNNALPAATLTQMGMDDVFYRALALALCPGLSEQSGASGNAGLASSRRDIDEICDYVLAHLADRITLTDLERLSGLTGRSLQLAFQKHFNCSPMQWVRNARLDLAHRRLRTAREGDTVIDIALASGLTLASSFSRAYQHRFGELPSVTLRRASGR